MANRSRNRERLMQAFMEAWNDYPSQRFGQLVANIAPEGIDLFYVDDESFEMAIWRFIETYPADK